MQKLRKQMTEPPPSVLPLRPEVGSAIDGLIRRMMARDPAERIQTPAELIEALDRISRGGPAPVAARERPRVRAHLVLAMGRRTHPPPAIPSTGQVRAHNGGIHSIAVAAEGHLLLTGGLDGAIKVWNAGEAQGSADVHRQLRPGRASGDRPRRRSGRRPVRSG